MKIVRRISSFILTLSVLVTACFGFDTGPHSDLTASVLRDRGFGTEAIQIVQVENWLTDFYSSRPKYDATRKDALEKLHFDNLYTPDQVDDYWAIFAANLKIAVEKAARSGDKLQMMIVMGIGLHAVQDFYAHSNWVETHRRTAGGPYRTETYLGSLSALPIMRVKDIHTGKYPAERTTGPWPTAIPAGSDLHGSYTGGINRDSPSRVGWDEAYVFAYCASHELMAAFERWSEAVRPGLWASVRTFASLPGETAKLAYDVAAARNISMWIKNDVTAFNLEKADGHWKGHGSGSRAFFTSYSGKWLAAPTSRFVKAFKDSDVQTDLARGLYTGQKSSMPAFERFSLKKRVIILETAEIGDAAELSFAEKAAERGESDYYLRSMINGQEFWGRVIQDSKRMTNPWKEIAFVDQTLATVPINLAVYDEDDADSAKDEQADINPAVGERDLDVLFSISNSMLSGDITGAFDSSATTFLSTGRKPDKHQASIKVFVTTVLLK